MQRIDKKFIRSQKPKVRLLLLLELLGGVGALAQQPGTFKPTGDMAIGRANHTATLLRNGRVLIAGGTTGSSITNAVEIYDPTTGIFTITNGMATARRSHMASILPDGRVLIAGGVGPQYTGVDCYPASGGCSQTSAELYDPVAGTFVPTGTMISGGGGKAILLPNGKVFIANRTAQLYDPATGTFFAAGQYADKEVTVSTATLLADGRVLMTGCGGVTCDVGVTELYDPGTDRFARTGPMSEWESANTATLLANGKVLFVGGYYDNVPSEAELYDPATGTFADTGNTIWPHDFGTATLLPDGTVLFTAARLSGGPITGGGELYDPVLGTFMFAGSMHTFPNQATPLDDGRVLVTGSGPARTQTSSAEIYDPGATVLWQQAITAMKTVAGTDSLNYWQWAWFWQRSPVFPGAPVGFGLLGSIDNTSGLIGEIIAAGASSGFKNISAEEWVAGYRLVIASRDPFQQAISAMKKAAGVDSYNFWQWAWFWQRSPTFDTAPAGFGVLGSIDDAPATLSRMIAAAGGNGFAVVSAEQWVQYYRQAASQ
jgi:hypothetical protein